MQDKEIEMLLRLIEAQVSLSLVKQNFPASSVNEIRIQRHTIEALQNTVNKIACCLRTEGENKVEEK